MTTTFLKDGKHMERNIQCNILVGTDCAGSTVRKLAGVDLKGEKDLQKLVSVHFMSLDLGDYLLNERPGMLFFVFNTEVIGVLVAHDLQQGEFVLQIPFFPPQQNLEDFSPEIAMSNTALSVQNFKAAMAVPSALGLDPTVANFGISNEHLFQTVIVRWVLWKHLLVVEETMFHQQIQGSRLPHIMNIKVLLTSSPEEIISTLDLVSGDKIKFLLIKAPLEDSYDLARSAFKVAEGFKVSIKLVNDVSSTLEKSQLDIHIIATKDDYNRRYMKMLSL
ncbi:hypothetical protein LWI29_000917 [Acer saccharum]|uniref:FAD-binding domain-containing protein n=1 Tax=Acer saccharum TaxID=4024 RepID=A0AA39RGJ5_ACESA|nr:hypothetical protein LWI29_000917 [Acer saccharum]